MKRIIGTVYSALTGKCEKWRYCIFRKNHSYDCRNFGAMEDGTVCKHLFTK